MQLATPVTPAQLTQILLNVAVIRPVFIVGAPGIGKSALVESFAEEVGLPCVSLLGSQLAPEDIMGVPQIIEGKTRFCPPDMIAKDEPYCLFLDELNACSQEVQKAFYSLILDRRVGNYELPEGSIIIGAGNRSQDNAIVKTMSSALINRMFFVELTVDVENWLDWAYQAQLDSSVLAYIQTRPDHLWSQPPKTEEPFSTPRSWHMLSDAMQEFGKELTPTLLSILANGCLTPSHAMQFSAFCKNRDGEFTLKKIFDGERRFPAEPENRDVLYFLAQSFRADLSRQLPSQKEMLDNKGKQYVHRSKALMRDLAQISLEMAQIVVAKENGTTDLPDWYLIEIIRDLPRLVKV